MNRYFLKTVPVVLIAVFLFLGFKSEPVKTSSYKCMIQMTNYSGEGAYIVISLLSPEGDYEKTLYVQGDDDEWYSDIITWWKFQVKTDVKIDAITGATINGGGRAICIIQIPEDKIDAGYKIRFESAVEDQEYYKDDVEFELTYESVVSKVEGKGFIRYVRLIKQVD
ncbi:MAG: flagellin biosynthesis protein FlgD [Flavobacteriaceae bacterium]|nr:MAG: flagellin biosynthesis protein FlgD [Flavobacteriaceae bacterium]